jgi:hypothetical protein
MPQIGRRKADDQWDEAPDPLLALAMQELAFYERTRNRARLWHQLTELTSLVSASATVIAAGLGAPALVTALAAGAALFTTGFRQVFNPADRWVLAARGWVALRQAVNRYRLLPEEDRGPEARQVLLDRIEETTAHDMSEWIDQRRQAHSQGRQAQPDD